MLRHRGEGVGGEERDLDADGGDPRKVGRFGIRDAVERASPRAVALARGRNRQ